MKQAHNVWVLGFAVTTICMIVVSSSASASSSFRGKPRTTRGFKNAALSTARGFGKRDGFYQTAELLPAEDYKSKTFGDDFRDMPDSESFPVDWFAEELSNNPQLARIVIKKFIDTNQDGELTIDELLRNPVY